MKVSLERSSANTIIAYDVGLVRVHARPTAQDDDASATIRQLSQSCIISPDQLIEDWSATAAQNLLASHMQVVLALEPEIVILGTGSRLHFPVREVAEACYAAGAGFEVMDTGAACRTYNILAGEGRRVVAALLMIGSAQ